MGFVRTDYGIKGHTSTRRRITSITLSVRVATICTLLSAVGAAQGLTGALIGTVRDAQGGVLPGARVRLSSPALIGGPIMLTSDEKGQMRFQTLPPGSYALDIELNGFASYHEDDIRVGAGATIERTAILSIAGLAESVVVEGAGSRIDARDPGFATRFGPEDLDRIPTRRASMFDAIRATPGVSPTSPSGGSGGGSSSSTTVSAFGSGTNENQFLIDGTNTTCPCNGVARSEAGVDFIQEVQLQTLGASAEFGNVQGAVINIVLKQGSERYLFDTGYYAQAAGLTSQPVLLRPLPPKTGETGYERARYRDLAATLGGPVVRDRLWFFTGYQYLRDYDSQPGSDPAFPRTYEQNKLFAKLTWRLSPAWQLMQSVHDQRGVNPDRPTLVTPFDALTRPRVSAPAMTFGHLTHTSANTVWDARVGRFVFSQNDESSTGAFTTASHQDRITRVTSGAPSNFGELTIIRNTAKATVSQYRPGLLGVDHQWKAGGQFERGEHHATANIPTGVRFVDNGTQPFQAITSPPANTGGVSLTASVFATDAITVNNRLTINAGIRFDHVRALSQDLHALDAQGHETSDIIPGLGTLYTWNLFSPRLGATTRLTADGRTVLRASYGRFSQGVLTGDIAPFHPGAVAVTTTGLVPGAPSSVVNPKVNLRLDPETQAPHTDEYGVGVDREVGRGLSVAIAYVGKHGDNFIGWTDVGGQYVDDTRTLPDRTVPVRVLVNTPGARRFLLTNPDGYSLTYNGLVMAAEKRRSNGWQAFGSYTFSRTYGLQVSSGATAGGPQVSTVAPPNPSTFGRDPNDLSNAYGRLPNDRPHIFRVMTSVDVPRTGLQLAANLQCFSGKPWAATTQIALPQGDQRVLLEPRGSRRLSSQSLLDLRVSRPIALGNLGRIDLVFDVLNALNDTAEEELATDNLFSPNFGQPTVFIDPRRAMISVRLHLGS
jgi:TonB dependent receptor/Carboxypeptidase regulatory-like domain/TonB-dependent Receptor Plug Domain